MRFIGGGGVKEIIKKFQIDAIIFHLNADRKYRILRLSNELCTWWPVQDGFIHIFQDYFADTGTITRCLTVILKSQIQALWLTHLRCLHEFKSYQTCNNCVILNQISSRFYALQWRHNGHDSVSNHQHYDCLLNRLFRRRSKKTSKLRVTGLFVGNSPGTGEFPAQMASYAENVSIWWRHHGYSFIITGESNMIETSGSNKCVIIYRWLSAKL